MSRRFLSVSLACIAALLIAAAWYLLRDRPEARQPPTGFAQAPTSSRPSSASASAAPTPVPRPDSAGSSHTDLYAQYMESRDLLAFSESLLDAAKAGDAASRYWLFRALDECSSGFGESQSLEEALTYAVQDAVDAEVIREWFARCEVLRGPKRKEFGDREVWLQAPVEAGYPLAKAHKALQLMGYEERSAPAQETREQARALAREALKSKDPAVIAMMGLVAVGMQGRQRPVYLTDSWLLAACLRGFDCGAHSEYVEPLCRGDLACQPFETGADLLRRRYGAEFNAVESLAREINDDIDAGRFDELGL